MFTEHITCVRACASCFFKTIPHISFWNKSILLTMFYVKMNEIKPIGQQEFWILYLIIILKKKMSFKIPDTYTHFLWLIPRCRKLTTPACPGLSGIQGHGPFSAKTRKGAHKLKTADHISLLECQDTCILTLFSGKITFLFKIFQMSIFHYFYYLFIHATNALGWNEY